MISSLVLVAEHGRSYNTTMANRAHDWFSQAEDDLLWARDTLKSRHYAQACFVCQQAAEKAIKSLALSRGFDQIKSHSIFEIITELDINDELKHIARRLDQYYISTRYPDAFPSGAPFQFFTEEQANEALQFADEFLLRIAALLNNGNE